MKMDLTLLQPSADHFNRFLRLPFKMITDALMNSKEKLSEVDAFILLLANVNYEDNLEYELGPCLRGESYRSTQSWSEMFKWDRSKTRRYFKSLSDGNVIKTENKGTTTWLKIIHYDYYVGKRNVETGDIYSKDFEEFWTKYHKIMMIPSTSKTNGFRIWKRLSTEERKKATAMIQRFFYNQDKARYCVKAVNYLRNKNFNDQFLC